MGIKDLNLFCGKLRSSSLTNVVVQGLKASA